MAKWGEGDPRWIVEERPDATNVNNWHWSEKDASGWSQDKFKSLLIGLEFEGPEGKCQTVEVEQCKGEATANNRKGKLIFFYEWNIKLKWTGRVTPPAPDPDDVTEEGEELCGEIQIPNLSEENEVEEIEVEVRSKKSDKDSQRLKELVHREAPIMIRDQIRHYLQGLKEEFSKGLILPRRESQQSTASSVSTASTPRQDSLSTTKSASRPSGSPVGCRIYTARLSMTDNFMASIEEIYNALTTQEMVEAFTRSKATVDAYRGGLYSILNGHITGEFVELDRPTKIVQKWRLNSWPEGHHSTVTIDLQQESSGTLLTLLQTEVPEAETERTREGWKRHIFESIKNTFGYGAHLF